jgi:hypothetical protein
MTTDVTGTRLAVLDETHAGNIRGVLGTIRVGDTAPRLGLSSRLKMLLDAAVIGAFAVSRATSYALGMCWA